MKKYFLLAVICFSLCAQEFTITNPAPYGQWQKGSMTWRFYGKWPNAARKQLRTVLANDPDFHEDESSGVITFRWCHERSQFTLYPGSIAYISFTGFILGEHSEDIIGCDVNLDGKTLGGLTARERIQDFTVLAQIVKTQQVP